MNKTFNQIFPTFQTWESKVLNYIKTNFNNPTWLGSAANQEYIYDRFSANFGEFNHSLKNDNLLVTKIIDIYTDEYPKKYNQDNNFNQIEWDKLNDKTDNYFRTIGSSDNIIKISDLPGNTNNTFESSISQELVSNSQTNENITKNINLYQEYLNSRNANFVNTFRIFLEKFEFLFQTFVNNEYENELEKYATFQSGEFVGDVPYLGLENQKDINELYNAYDFVINNKQDKIVAGKNVQVIDNKIINVVGLPTFEEIYDLIIVSLVPWKNNIPYAKDTIVNAISDTNVLYKFQSLVDNNIDNNPFTSTGQWKQLASQPVDLNEITNLVLERLKEGDLQTVINEELDKLATVNYVSEYKDQVIPFKDNTDFNAFKLATGTTDRDYETIDMGGGTWTKLNTRIEGVNLRIDNFREVDLIYLSGFYQGVRSACQPVGLTFTLNNVNTATDLYLPIIQVNPLSYGIARVETSSGTIYFGFLNSDFNIVSNTNLEAWGRKL